MEAVIKDRNFYLGNFSERGLQNIISEKELREINGGTFGLDDALYGLAIVGAIDSVIDFGKGLYNGFEDGLNAWN
ncbi:lactococcin G-beta/enterocin 1071B family bacteriocin [Aceticella autotrophica]|uniref:Lactococcin G-beta/enterocin 1071B family bacteriocin n=1 Tax=Aceticella autotrophica TaxID=2755338 RepID=A0A974Y3X8_9THEO|nr:lactococcin G-beta/enterocin 1071B family bacteriocin [Aceticella autotrophica]QSZ26470.1 lactococcin G-beta/enterocin 1071B family bacteriocin [Aceticella autotrophica]